MSGGRARTRTHSALAARRLRMGMATALVAAGIAGCTGGSGGSGETGAAPELVAGSLGTDPGEMRFPRAIAVDPGGSGRFWVTDRLARIQLFDTEGRLLAGWRTPEHEFGAPVGLAADRDGTLLVSDSHYHRVLRYTFDGRELLASFGEKGTGPGQLTYGRDLVVDSQGNIYVGDYGSGNDRVEKFSPDGTYLFEWGRQGSAEGEFTKIHGMAIEVHGKDEFLLVADQCNHRIQRFDLEGRFVSSFGSLGSGPGELRYPSSVAVGPDGSIYVSEWGNHRVQRFDRTGRPLGSWGRAGKEEGELATPWDVEVGPDGRIYVADYGNHRVQVFRWGGKETEDMASR